MRSIALVSIAFLAFPLLGSPAFGGAVICGLPAGSDNFSDSEGVGLLPVPGVPGLMLPFAACGPTFVSRGDPVPGPLPGQCTIPTEIVSMTLMGVFDPCGANLPILITEDPGVRSTGAVTSDTSGGLPASSFFDVYTMVTVGAMPPFPSFAHVVEDSLRALPPGSTTPGGPPCVNPGDDVYAQGFPAHEHRPCPRKTCCQLPCGRTLHLSCEACERYFQGHCYEGDCPFLCASQAVEPRNWGQVKRIYRD